MSKSRLIRTVLLSCAVALVLPAVLSAQESDPNAPNVYVSCQHRVAAIFPSAPTIRDISYTNGGRTVPARQFSVDRGMDRYSVTVADFSNAGPAIDAQVVENAAIAFRQRGEVRLQFPEDYTPGIPGRQISLFDANGRQHRSSIYMADHHLYMAETYSEPNDTTAIQLEQSMLLISATGADLNNVANPNRY